MNTSRMIALGAVACLFFAMPGARAADQPDSEQVSRLLSDAKTMAYQLKEDAFEMETFTRMTVSWQSHAVAIARIREHVNALGKQASKLKEMRTVASPWQRTAIDRMEPYLDELGGYISAAIEHVNDKQHSLIEYNDYLEANADYASDLATMISNFVDYGKTRQRLERLSSKLEIPQAK